MPKPLQLQPHKKPLDPKLAEALKLEQERVEAVDAELTQKTAELQQLKIDVTAAKAKVAQAFRETVQAIKVRDGVVAKAQADAKTAQAAHDQLVAVLATKKQELERQIATLAGQINEANGKYNELLGGCKKAAGDLDDTLKEITEAKSTLERTRAANADELGKIQVLTEQLEALKTQIADAEVLKTNGGKMLVSLAQQVKALQNTKSEAVLKQEDYLRRLVATTKQLKAYKAKLEQHIERFNTYLATEQKKLESARRELEQEKLGVANSKRKLASDRSLLNPLS